MQTLTPTKSLILLIEDDQKLSSMMADFLTSEGFEISVYDQGFGAAEEALKLQPDLIVLDVMLPDVDGVEICRQIKQKAHIPILMLTAKEDDMTEILAMNLGADAYLNKPIRPHVLQAHINATLRKKTTPTDNQALDKLLVQDLTIDTEAYTVHKNEVDLLLTAGEFELLVYLAQNKGRPVGREKLLKELKGIEYDGQDRSIDIRISNLRKKLDDELPPYKYIKTVRNQGYLLVK